MSISEAPPSTQMVWPAIQLACAEHITATTVADIRRSSQAAHRRPPVRVATRTRPLGPLAPVRITRLADVNREHLVRQTRRTGQRRSRLLVHRGNAYHRDGAVDPAVACSPPWRPARGSEADAYGVGAQVSGALNAHLARNLASMLDDTRRARHDHVDDQVGLARQVGHGVHLFQAALNLMACPACSGAECRHDPTMRKRAFGTC